MTRHTPGPYRIDEFLELRGCGDEPIASIHDWSCEGLTGKDDNTEANAEFIVRAVNSHDELVTMLYQCLEMQEMEGYIGCKTVEEAQDLLSRIEASERKHPGPDCPCEQCTLDYNSHCQRRELGCVG